jgi:DNA-binding response OmpR family regulator
MASSKKKILIVEDDEAIGAMYKGKFEADGYMVFGAVNGVEGLEIARKEKPDMIFLDVILPQMDGFAVLAELKKDAKTKNIPVIMLTNLGTDEDKNKGEKMGAADYIVKANMTPAEISEKIKKIIK